MKSKLKVLVSLLLVLAMIFSISVTAFAENGEEESPSPSPSTDPTTDPTTPPTTEPSKEPVDNVKFEINSITPSGLVDTGEVVVKMTVTNNGDEISDIKIFIDSTLIANYSTLAKGSSKTTEYTYKINVLNLDKEIPVQVSYLVGGSSKSKNTTLKVKKEAPKISVSSAVKPEKTTVQPGEKVKINFAIENKGNVALTNCSVVSPEMNDGEAIQSKFDIAPGESKTFSYSVTLEETLETVPTFYYTVGDRDYEKDLDSISITVLKADIVITANTDATEITEGDTVPVKISLSNLGNVEIRNIALACSDGNRVTLTDTVLKVGQTLETAYEVVASKETESYVFTFTGVDENGKEYTYDSNILYLTVGSKDYSSLLGFTAAMNTADYDKEKKFTVTFNLKNDSDITFTDLKITEGTIGDIPTSLTAFEPGQQTYTYTAEQILTGEVTFIYKLSCIDPDGNTIILSSDPITVNFGEEKKGGPSFFTVLLIILLIGLVIGGGILFFIYKKNNAGEAPAPRRAKAAYSDDYDDYNEEDDEAPVTRKPVAETQRRSGRPERARYQRPQPVAAPAIEDNDDVLENINNELNAAPADDSSNIELDAEFEEEITELPRRSKPIPKVKPSRDIEDRNNF